MLNTFPYRLGRGTVKSAKGFEVRNRPDWLYNSLPYLYVAIGLIAIAGFGLHNVLGILTGILLVVTGILVFTMRKMQRRELAKVRAEINESEKRKSDGEYTPLGLSWEKEYESGNPVIDEQHSRFFDRANTLLKAMLANKRSAEISNLLDSFLDDMQHHFLTEEETLSGLGHPITTEHKTEHDQLLFRAKWFVNKYNRGTLKFDDVSEFRIFDLIAEHIATEDKQYFASHP